MRLGAVLSPMSKWEGVVEAARLADELGFDAIGLWGHYHSAQPEWAYISGWSAYGALASMTRRVRLVPMVLNNLHYQPGVLAKESSLLALASGDRFELGIGAGDWPESYAAWGERFPDRRERVDRLGETLTVLRRLWTGERVTFDGGHVRLRDACCTPAPPRPPRVIVGVGNSLSAARATVEVADELNIYAETNTLAGVRDVVAASGRQVDVSIFFAWEWDNWPADPLAELGSWRSQGVGRAFVSLGSDDLPGRLRQLAPLLGSSAR